MIVPSRVRARALTGESASASGPHWAIRASAWAAATSISVCSFGRHAGQRGDLERDDQRVADRGPGLIGARQRDHRDPLGARLLGQRAARRADDPPRPDRARGLEGGQRLLGLPRIARAQHGRVGGDPGRQRVVARGGDRPRGAVAEHRLGQRAADGRPAHPGHDEAAGRVLRGQVGRLHAPQGVAQVLGQVEDVGQLTGRVNGGDRLAGKRVPTRPRAQNATAPSGICTPGKIRIPAVRTLPAPIDTPWPSTTPRSIRQLLPDRHLGGEDRVDDPRARADPASVEQNRGFDVGAGGQVHARAEHRAPAHRGVALDHAAGPEHRRAVHAAVDLSTVVADPAGRRRRCGPRPSRPRRRGCRRWPAGSGPACRCPSSTPTPRSRTARARRARGTGRARSSCASPPEPSAPGTSRSIT